MMPNVTDLYAGRPVMLPQVVEIESQPRQQAQPGRAQGLVAGLARIGRTLLALFL